MKESIKASLKKQTKSMWTILIIFSAGMVTGYTIKNLKKLIDIFGKTTTLAIWLLLFLMGVSVGTNEMIMSSLHTIGFKALLVSAFSIAGSIGAIVLIGKKITGGKPA